MAFSLGEAFLRARPDMSRFGSELNEGAEKAGADAGKKLADGLHRGADGRLRDARGKFVTSLDGSVGAAADESGRKAAATVSRHMSGISFGGLARSVTGVLALLGAGGIAGAAVSMGIKTAAGLEQAQIGFATLLGSGQQAQSFLSNLQKFAAATPFELPGLIDTSRMLLGVGVAAKDVIPTLTAWGDAAGAVGISQDAFKRTMVQVTQAISAGVIRTGDMNIIAENGIPIWKLLSESTGKSVVELRKMAETGQLLASDVLPRVQAQMGKDYGGAMARQSQTLAGVWSTVKDTVAIGLANSLKPLVPILTELLPKGADLAGRGLGLLTVSLAWVITTAQRTGPFLRTVWLGILALVAAFREGDVTSDGFVGAMEILGVTLRAVVDATVATVRWLGQHQAVAIGLAATIGALVLVTRAHAAVMAVEAAGGLIKYITQVNLVTTATKVWTAVQWLLNVALVANPIGIVILAVAALVAGFIYAWTHSETFRKVVTAALRDIGAGALVLWHNVIEPAFQGIAAVASWLWTNILQPAFRGLVFYIQNFVAPVMLMLWRNVAEPVFAGIRFAVEVAWAVIRIILGLIEANIRYIVAPALLWLWHHVVEPVWQGIAGQTRWVWENVLRPILTLLGSIIETQVAPKFRKGVDMISAAWSVIREMTAAPVRFVVNTVLNKGIIGSWNWIHDHLKVGSHVDPIGIPFAGGGRIPGDPSARDNILAMGPAGPIALATGEYIVNSRQTARHLPLLAAINAGVEGFADGGLIGLVTNPAGWLRERIGGAVDAVPGAGPFRDMVAGFGRSAVDAAIGAVKSLIGSAGSLIGIGGGGGGGIGWQAMWNIISAAFPWAQLMSGFRPGDRVASGGLSYHALGRAIDITPSMEIGRWIAAHFMAVTKELIHTPMGAEQVWNGHPWTFTGADLQAAHYNHVHWAMAGGGQVGGPAREIRLDTYSIDRIVQALSARPLNVGISGPNAWGLSVAGVAP